MYDGNFVRVWAGQKTIKIYSKTRARCQAWLLLQCVILASHLFDGTPSLYHGQVRIIIIALYKKKKKKYREKLIRFAVMWKRVCCVHARSRIEDAILCGTRRKRNNLQFRKRTTRVAAGGDCAGDQAIGNIIIICYLLLLLLLLPVYIVKIVKEKLYSTLAPPPFENEMLL